MAFPDGWQRKCAIVIQAAQVAETLTDFPLLVTGDNLPAEIWANADDGGGDLRFSADDAGAVRLACEIVSFSTSGENAEIYVKVPSVSSAINTTIYIWYNNTGQTQPPATDTYGSQAVWGSDYAAVYHFNQNPAGGTLLDSTANGNNGTPQGGMDAADLADGQISANSAWTFDGSQKVIIPDNNTLDIIGDIGFIVIAKAAAISPASFTFLGKRSGTIVEANYAFRIYSADIDFFFTNAGYKIWQFNANLSTNTYYLHALSYNSIDQPIYWRDKTMLSPKSFSPATTMQADNNNLAIAGSGDLAGERFAGDIDEIQILSATLNSNAVASIYNNYLTPATFAIAGTPTAVSAFNPAWAKHSNQIIRAL